MEASSKQTAGEFANPETSQNADVAQQVHACILYIPVKFQQGAVPPEMFDSLSLARKDTFSACSIVQRVQLNRTTLPTVVIAQHHMYKGR